MGRVLKAAWRSNGAVILLRHAPFCRCSSFRHRPTPLRQRSALLSDASKRCTLLPHATLHAATCPPQSPLQVPLPPPAPSLLPSSAARALWSTWLSHPPPPPSCWTLGPRWVGGGGVDTHPRPHRWVRGRWWGLVGAGACFQRRLLVRAGCFGLALLPPASGGVEAGKGSLWWLPPLVSPIRCPRAPASLASSQLIPPLLLYLLSLPGLAWAGHAPNHLLPPCRCLPACLPAHPPARPPARPSPPVACLTARRSPPPLAPAAGPDPSHLCQPRHCGGGNRHRHCRRQHRRRHRHRQGCRRGLAQVLRRRCTRQ